ncbi:alkyl hydroperoxide reductase subunit F [Arcanobacterium hippocoleae]|uniref:alkyl hydroperoxide reductase subunit F n=1 Tax=Arcanobacterium hippocoleae TaxID=149017 RepID=UPI003340920B
MFLDQSTLSQLGSVMTNIKLPIRLEATLDDSKRSTQMREMLQQTAALSDLVTFTEVLGKGANDGESTVRTPSFAIVREGAPEVAVRFAGLPMGEEFTSFVLALVQVGGHPVRADQEVLDAAAAIDQPHEFVTYMSLTCQNCPTVVQALNALAVLNPGITHTAVEGGANQAEIQKLGIKSVPTIFMDGKLFGQGRMDLAQIISKLDTSSDAKRAERLNQLAPFDVLVVGGGPAGATAAIYSARKGLRVAMAGERVGGQVLDTATIENLAVTKSVTGPGLAGELEVSMRHYGVEILSGLIATKLHEQDSNGLFAVDFGDATLRAKQVIIATGARYRTTGVPGEDDYRNRGVSFCPHCDGPLFKGKPVAVIGGGNSAIEAAIDLAGLATHVTVVEMMPELKADDVLQKKLNSLPNTTVITSAKVSAVKGDGTEVTALEYADADGKTQSVNVNGIFVQIGLIPNSEWVSDILHLNRGGIVVDEQLMTSLPGVFAAGDVTDTPFKQVVVALGAGAKAAISAFDYSIRL